MAERRRIIPASVGPLFTPKEDKSWKPAVRFTLTLDDPNDTKCTEFSYRELYKNAVGETGDDKNFNDLDEEDISGLAAFAKRFEEKYAAEGGKKKRREHMDDLIDAGMGYDDTDPFVDNSECYDELVPSMLTTQLGGFYINQGTLNFREISDSEGDDDFVHVAKSRKKKTPGKKKRKSSFEEKERKRRKQEKKEKKAKKQLQKQFGSKKKKITNASPTVAELLKRQKHGGAPKQSTSLGDLVNGNTTNNASKEDIDPLDNIDPSLDLGLGGDFKMDSDMAAVMEEALASIGDSDALGGSEDSIGNGNMLDPVEEEEEQYVKCPDGTSAELLAYVEKIKDAARKSVEGKCKFFTPSVNQLLLKIELKSREMTCGTRSQMYSHLAFHLPCGKETLLKRAKKLRLGAQDGSIKEPLQKLREAIVNVMPENNERYKEECKTHALEKATRQLEGKEEGKVSDDEDDKKSKQGNYGPRKKFQWNDQIRILLCDVMRIKLKTYEVLKSRSQTAEDYVKAFLEMEVKPLWPQGWIQTRMLYKETRSVHGHLTSNQPMKPKKVVLATKKQAIRKPNTEGTSASQSSMSVASMIRQAIMSPSSNQSTPASDKSTPSERVPTLLDYANMSSDLDSASTSPNAPFSNQTTPKTSLPSTKYNVDSTNNAASLQGNSTSGVNDFTASFMEKLIADELAASDKMPGQGHKTPNESRPSSIVQNSQQMRQTVPKTSPTIVQGQDSMSIADIIAATAKAMETTPVPKERQASSVLQQLSTHAQNNAASMPSQPQTFAATSQPASRPLTYATTSKPVVSGSKPQTFAATSQPASRPLTYTATSKPVVSGSKPQTYIATSKPAISGSKPQTYMATSKMVVSASNSQIFAAKSKPTASMSKQQTFAVTSKPVVSKASVVRKQEAFGSGQERLKKLNLGIGKRTIVTASAAKQIAEMSGNMNLTQTIQKLSSTLKSSPSVSVSTSNSQSGKPQMVAGAYGSAPKYTMSNSNTQPVVHLTRPPTLEKQATPRTQVRMATPKGATIRMVTTDALPKGATIRMVTSVKPHLQINSNSKTTTPPVRTETTKQPTRVSVQTLRRSLSSGEVGQLTSANLQAGMGNIFANLNESYGSSASKELPYFAASTTSGKNSHPKTNQPTSPHMYRQQTSPTPHRQQTSPTAHRQQTSPTAHPVHSSSYTSTKVSKQLSASGSAFTAPSPPKHKPSTPPTLSPSTSPVGQKYPAYASQRTSPNQTSPKYPASYTTAMAAVPGYQHLSLADLTHKQQAAAAASGFTQGYPLSANQGQVSTAAGQGSGDAIITGPAPGTFYHQQPVLGGMVSPMQSPTTKQQFQLPPWAQ